MVNRALAQGRRLASIRAGPGAARLPIEYSRLRLSFASRNANGHMGPRKFAQAYLAQLSFHNPALQIDVTRALYDPNNDPKNLQRPATLELFSGTAPAPSLELDVRGMHSEEILRTLIDRTGATLVADDSASSVPPHASAPAPL